MKVVITETALTNLEHGLEFMRKRHPENRCIEVGRNVILSTYELADNPFIGQIEPILEDLKLKHRRIIVGHFKVVYRIIEEQNTVLVTDIFDSRQDPAKMRS
ncbi:MAG: type II toxin-antitoxin system RelE/ParE family toxin [Bacteroidetes bacterium]|nr:MAG: type II toxin-antitoxin system RelE/ParE family toxin [Bacteroidota bacterium]